MDVTTSDPAVTNSNPTPVIFREEQRLTQAWLRWTIILSAVSCFAVVGVMIWGMVQQLVYDRPFGNHPISDRGLIVASTLTIVVCVVVGGGVLWLLRASRLVTEVREAGLFVRFHPLGGQTIPFAEIDECFARDCQPIAEYGGWGVRFSLGNRGKAYLLSGRRGVQLVFTTGKRLFIGSQRADDLAATINRMRPGTTGGTNA
jgi:hypothetical protein